ncbi:MAG: hypothetical protein RRA32_10545 [bacterium]|nr:hypothetical protein [bacterium]
MTSKNILVVGKLLLLSSLEARGEIRDLASFTAGEIHDDIREAYLPRLAKKRIELEVAALHDGEVSVDNTADGGVIDILSLPA